MTYAVPRDTCVLLRLNQDSVTSKRFICRRLLAGMPLFFLALHLYPVVPNFWDRHAGAIFTFPRSCLKPSRRHSRPDQVLHMLACLASLHSGGEATTHIVGRVVSGWVSELLGESEAIQRPSLRGYLSY